MSQVGQNSADEQGTGPEGNFEKAWEEINDRLARLRLDLDLADRVGLGEETKKSIAHKLYELQKTVDEFAERWMEFERRRRNLEDRMNGPL
jgi:hypothetical protein